MCEIHSEIHRWTEKRKYLTGVFEIEPHDWTKANTMTFALFADGSSWLSSSGGCNPPGVSLCHFFVLHIAGKRLLAYQFGIDFSLATGDALAASIVRALEEHSGQLRGVVNDVQDVLAIMKTTIQGLCNLLPTDETIKHMQDKAASERKTAPLVHSPGIVPKGFEGIVEASESFRARDAARTAAA